jgi:glycosyltransferase involved in cell wall biosynthesis
MKFSLIIPARNEEKSIERTLNDILNVFKNEDFEVIVVCNNCSDSTYEIVKKFKEPIKSLNFPERIGKGGAITEGFKVSSGDLIGFVDADGSYDPKLIKKMIDELKKGNFDCVIASRKSNRISSGYDTMTRNIASLGWNIIVKSLLGLPFYDTQAGLKFFRKSVLDFIGKEFMCRNFCFDVELLWKIKQEGFKIKEISAKSKSINETSISIRDVLEMLSSLFKFWFIVNFNKK